MEEFERAVRSHGQHSDDNTTARHRQFIAAIGSQISRVEEALIESFNGEGKDPLQWVNLDQEECDDLALFLSGIPGTLQNAKEDHVELRHSMKDSPSENHYKRREMDFDFNLNVACNRDMPDEIKGFKDVVTINKDATYVIELEAKEVPGTRDDISCQADRLTGTRRTGNSPPGSWKIVIADEDEHSKKLAPSIEATPKGKGSRAVLWKQRWSEHPHAKRGINWFNQVWL